MTDGFQQDQTRTHRVSTWCAAIALVMMALSVSLSQLFMALTLISFALEWFGLRRRGILTERKRPRAQRSIIAAAGLLFFWLLLSSLAHAPAARNPAAAFAGALKSELGDAWIFLFGMTVLALARNVHRRRLLLGALGIFAVVLVLSGLVALFSEFRPAKILTGHGFIPSARNRPQHPFALLPGGIRLFQPIGFMNTRLTYAGLLVMILPFLFGHARDALGALKNPTIHRPGVTGPALRALAACVIPAMALFILYANRTRSAQLGLLGALAFAALIIGARYLIQRRSLTIALLILLLPLGSLIFLNRESLLNQTRALRTHNSRFTDAYRPIIWTGTGALIRENPFLGIGPGAFPEATRAWREGYARKHPEIWYFTRNAPDGHAHNDVLHLAAVGGLPAGLCFLIFMFLCARETGHRFARSLRQGDVSHRLFLGLLTLFPAGLFQCYFQDDEVVVLFWVLAALAMASSEGEYASANLEEPATSGNA